METGAPLAVRVMIGLRLHVLADASINLHNSIGAPFTSMKATRTPRLGLLGSMITFWPWMEACRSSTSNATWATVFTRVGTGASSQYLCHWMPNGLFLWSLTVTLR